MATRYRVYLTPRVSLEEYGDEIEISEWVTANLGTVTRSIDSTDYRIGVFTYSDLNLVCENSSGRFNDFNDSRSLFPYSRDQAKVRVVYEDDDGTTITFRGVIADAATRIIPREDEIEFQVLGRDSVLRQAQVAAGTVTTGMTFEQALNAILNSQEVTRVLGFDAANINPDYNGTVGDGSKFDKKSKKDAVNELLLASNSIMLLDEDDNIIITSRTHDTTKDPLELFGPGDLHGRENITDLPEYNTGLHRVFNSIKINETEETDETSRATYGLRKKEDSFDWVTDTAVEEAIASALVDEFKNQKTELSVEVPTFLAKDYDLLDRVSIDYPLIRRPSGEFFPISGITVSGDETAPTPFISGSVVIDPNVAFKIIEIAEDPKTFMTVLKLRQIGTGASDGFFS